MSSGPNPSSTKQFLLALVIVLSGVAVGSLLVMKKEEPGRSQRPMPAPKVANPGGSPNRDHSWTNQMVWIPAGCF